MMLTIAFVLIVYLLWRTSALGDEILTLEQTVRSLQRPSGYNPPLHAAPEPPLQEHPRDDKPQQCPPPVPPPLPEPIPAAATPERFRQQEPEPEPEPHPAVTDPPPLIESRNWEEAIGGNWLNKIGAVILVIGIALFLGYSFASMGPLGRTLTAASLGSALLGAGLWLERKDSLKLFSYGLLASGWATLYFTAYAAHAVDAARVIANPVIGMGLMVAAAAAMVIHSLRYRSEPLTALAYACVYAALGLSDINTAVLFALFPLAISMHWISRRLGWTYTTLFSACATYAVFLTRGSTGAPLYLVEGLLLAYWIMFEAMDVVRPSIAFAVNAFAGIGAGAYIWHNKSPESMWLFCTIAAVLYMASSLFRAITRQDDRPALGISAALTALAIFAQTDGLWTAVFVAMEAEVLFLIGTYLDRPFLRVLSYAGFFLSLGTVPWLDDQTRLPGLLVHACVFYFNRTLRPNLPLFGYLATALVSTAVALHAPFQLAGIMYLSFAAVLFEVGYRRMLSEFRYQAYASAVLGALGAIAYRLHPSYTANPWILSAATLMTFAMLIRAAKFLRALPESETTPIRLVGSVALAALSAATLSTVVSHAWWGFAWFTAAVVLLELGIRRVPQELVLGSIPLMLAGVMASTMPVSAHPSLAMCAVGFAAVVRLLFWQDSFTQPIRAAVLAVTAIFGYFALWEMMARQWHPVTLVAGAFMIAELGRRFRASDLIYGQMAIAGIATVLALFQHPLEWQTAVPVFGVLHLLALRQEQRLQTWAATAVAAMWMSTALHPWTCLGFAILSVGMLFLRERLQSGICIGAALAFAIFSGGVPVLALILTLGALVTGLYSTRGRELRQVYACTLAVSAVTMLFQHAEGGMLTLSLGGLGVVLLALGFGTAERPLRLNGLAVLMLCILKLFIYDLGSLETIYRILSFIGLGIILLAVSWVYTRYKHLF